MYTHKLGIVLSGGGARGFAHIGVLKALNEHRIFPDSISAVSAGSIVGALYADGYSPDEIYSIFAKLDLYKLLKFYKPAFGLLRADGLKKILQHYLHATTFEELKIPLQVTATNFTKAKAVQFNSGNLIDAVMASCAIPLAIKPMMINGEYYVDGGLMNNLPVDVLVGKCEEIIGVNVNPVTEATRISSLRNYADRVMHLAVRANVEPNIAKCDIYIEPEGLMNYHLFKVSASKEIYQLGYQHTLKILKSIANDRF